MLLLQTEVFMNPGVTALKAWAPNFSYSLYFQTLIVSHVSTDFLCIAKILSDSKALPIFY